MPATATLPCLTCRRPTKTTAGQLPICSGSCGEALSKLVDYLQRLLEGKAPE